MESQERIAASSCEEVAQRCDNLAEMRKKYANRASHLDKGAYTHQENGEKMAFDGKVAMDQRTEGRKNAVERISEDGGHAQRITLVPNLLDNKRHYWKDEPGA